MTMKIKGKIGRRKSTSRQPRKQRLMRENSPLHRRRRMVSAHLSEELWAKYYKRSIPLRKGDTVKIMRGEYKGKVTKVVKVDYRKVKVSLDGVVSTKADGKQKEKWVDPSNVMLVKLDLSDDRRKQKLEEHARTRAVEEEDNQEEV